MTTAYATAEDIEHHIADRVNAARTWAGPIVAKMRSEGAITNARRQATAELFESIARNPKHGDFGAIAAFIEITHNAHLPLHSGEAGIPQIVPFTNAAARAGFPADPDEIDAWRESPERFTGAVGAVVAHNAKGADNKMSPLACRYSLVNSFFKFTGLSAEIPLVIITDALVDEQVPLGLAAAVVKLSIPKLVKPSDDLYGIARQDAADGRDDLVAIEQGARTVRPPRAMSDVAMAQKQTI